MFATSIIFPWSTDDRGPTHGAPFYRYLDDAGDGTGTKNAIADYSGALEEFFIEPPAGQEFWITRLTVQVRWASPLQILFYIPGAALVNGIEIQKRDGVGVLIDLTDGLPVTMISDWGRNFDLDMRSFSTIGAAITGSWHFAASGLPVRLRPGERLTARLNDNFTTITGHTFKADGISLTAQQ